MKPTPTPDVKIAKPGELGIFINEVALNYSGEDCLIWPFRSVTKGYGRITIGGRHIGAHRYVCERVHGQPPTPKHEAAHGCGNRACVNPRHLRWATSAENMADKLMHDTHVRGDRQPTSKLTKLEALKILRLKGARTQREIAREFGVSPGAIANIHSGRNWAWLKTESNNAE